MNMKGGYSYPDYKTLLEEKKTDINEFINSFIPVLKEYRANYNGEGSAAGKKRAELVRDIYGQRKLRLTPEDIRPADPPKDPILDGRRK